MIVTICGSKRFNKEIMESYGYLTSEGRLVFIPAIGNVSEKERLKLQFEKIMKSDAIFVVDEGEETMAEIAFAEVLKKRIEYYSDVTSLHDTLVNNSYEYNLPSEFDYD